MTLGSFAAHNLYDANGVLFTKHRFICTRTPIRMSEWMKPALVADCLLGTQYFKWYMIKCVAPTLSIAEVKMPMQTICHNCDRYLIYDMHHRPTNVSALQCWPCTQIIMTSFSHIHSLILSLLALSLWLWVSVDKTLCYWLAAIYVHRFVFN